MPRYYFAILRSNWILCDTKTIWSRVKLCDLDSLEEASEWCIGDDGTRTRDSLKDTRAKHVGFVWCIHRFNYILRKLDLIFCMVFSFESCIRLRKKPLNSRWTRWIHVGAITALISNPNQNGRLQIITIEGSQTSEHPRFIWSRKKKRNIFNISSLSFSS